MLGHLPHLKYLYLDGLTKVTSIRSSLYGNIDNCKRDAIIVVFRALERLKLENMSNLKEWDEVDFPYASQVFPRLKYLRIYKCWQLTRAPSHFPWLEELEIDGMESSTTFENIREIKLTSLTRLVIEDIKGLECFPDWLFSNNHNLTKLEISKCPKMLHLVPRSGGGGAPSLLRELRISDYRSLRELPDGLHRLNSLEKLYIWDCPNMKNLPIEMVESCDKSLEKVKLIGLSSITNIPMLIGCLHRMTRLRELDIRQVPKFSSKDIIRGSLIFLQELTIGPFSSSDSSWDNNVSFNETLVAILLPQSIGSLRTLHLHGNEHWDSLPDQIQHLTSLETLRLLDFGIEALPEWFGNLSSLKQLYLRG